MVEDFASSGRSMEDQAAPRAQPPSPRWRREWYASRRTLPTTCTDKEAKRKLAVARTGDQSVGSAWPIRNRRASRAGHLGGSEDNERPAARRRTEPVRLEPL